MKKQRIRLRKFTVLTQTWGKRRTCLKASCPKSAGKRRKQQINTSKTWLAGYVLLSRGEKRREGGWTVRGRAKQWWHLATVITMILKFLISFSLLNWLLKSKLTITKNFCSSVLWLFVYLKAKRVVIMVRGGDARDGDVRCRISHRCHDLSVSSSFLNTPVTTRYSFTSITVLTHTI